ncbi:hypothetical protein Y032_0010g1023 [Ancylostoma ceylanicum]|uniref:SCP domain-containing protein n=1 Tax=Ancylostoma ceylanicum TaxID=53326 RepID=A0A016VFZ1_9BILA|nr:hypothetical protein Y032_0010g1023 [Ancylostoma ceylanicum]
MFVLLLVLLCISGASSQQPKAGCSNTPTDPIREAVLTNHNNIRKKIVGDPNGAPTDRVEQDDATFLPGSKNLFMITYDCGLEGLAMTAAADCPSKPKLDYIPAEKSVNHKIERSATKPQNDNEYAEAVKRAVEDWYDSHYEDNLDPKTVIYQNEAMEPFANIIYKNTIAVGCAVQWCDARKRLVTACVYNAKPKVGEALYNPGKPGAKCTTDKQCAKVIKGATCEKADGLCKTDLKDMPTDTTTTTELVTESTTTETESTTTETESTTTETESTTAAADTTTRSSGGLSQNLRDKIEDMHNYYRRELTERRLSPAPDSAQWLLLHHSDQQSLEIHLMRKSQSRF